MSSECYRPHISPGETKDAYPDIFNIKAMPPQSKTKKPGQLTGSAIRQYFEQGYVIVENFFTRDELDPCRDSIDQLVEDLAHKLHKAGKLEDLYRGYGFYERMIKIEAECPGANVILHKHGRLPQSFRNVWSNERLLNVVEQLIGPDIAGNPNWNLRPQTPQSEALTVPWHQDSGYLDNDSHKVLIPTVWIPFLDTSEKNGCLEVGIGGHRSGRIATHKGCHGDTWYIWIEEKEMEQTLGVDLEKDLKVCPIPYGGFLLFSNILPHRSLPNTSEAMRWSVDLRFQRSDQPYGLWGLKEGVVLRSSKDPNMKVDWETFDSVDRTTQQIQSVRDNEPADAEDELEPIIQGPWMKKWEMVHVNKHVLRHRKLDAIQNELIP